MPVFLGGLGKLEIRLWKSWRVNGESLALAGDWRMDFGCDWKVGWGVIGSDVGRRCGRDGSLKDFFGHPWTIFIGLVSNFLPYSILENLEEKND